MAQLEIIEQPSKSFRTRYISEQSGTHGHIEGESSTRSFKTLPKVCLHNCPHQKAIIRCTLATVDLDHQHPCQLVTRAKPSGMLYEPHDVIVSDQNWTAEFRVGIIQTAKRNIEDVLRDKYERVWKKKEGNANRNLTTKQKLDFGKQAKEEILKVDLNSVRLRFEALDENQCPILDSFGQPLVQFSNSISNSKCAANNQLVITKSSLLKGSCRGNDNIMLFVSKVDEKNIKVKFYTEDINGGISWEDEGRNLHVHHQYGISFDTPPFIDGIIESETTVYYKLVRPKDGAFSAAKEFFYLPDETLSKKRKMDELPESNQVKLNSSNEFDDLLYGDPLISSSEILVEDLDLTQEEIDLVNFVFTDCTTKQPNKRLVRRGQLQQGVWAVLAHGDKQDLCQLLSRVAEEERKVVLESFNNVGLAAVHQAAKRGDAKLLECVLQYEVDPEAVDKCSGSTALHLAVQGGHKDAAVLLIREAAALVHVVDWKGQTPLHYATLAESAELCELLLDADADFEVSDLEGKCPLQLVRGNDVLEQLFRKYVDDLDQLFKDLVVKCDEE